MATERGMGRLCWGGLDWIGTTMVGRSTKKYLEKMALKEAHNSGGEAKVVTRAARVCYR